MINKKRIGTIIISVVIILLSFWGGFKWRSLYNPVGVAPVCLECIEFDLNVDRIGTLVNEKRVENGLKPLTVNKQLVKSSVYKAREMIDLNYFAHKSPDGSEPWDFFKSAGYTNWSFIGENLAKGYLTSDEVVTGWMNSQEHKDIMLEKTITEMGVAVEFGIYNNMPAPYIVLHVGKRI